MAEKDCVVTTSSLDKFLKDEIARIEEYKLLANVITKTKNGITYCLVIDHLGEYHFVPRMMYVLVKDLMAGASQPRILKS